MPAEHGSSPEIKTLPPFAPLEGMQLRLVLPTDYLDSSVEVPPSITSNDIISTQQRSYEPIQNASTYNRIEESRGITQNQWIQNTLTVFQDSNNREIMQKLKPFFQKATGNNDISQQSINTFYQRFFANDQAGIYTDTQGNEFFASNINDFVGVILNTHRNADNRIDRAALQKNLPAYQWLSKIFGSEVSETITQLIDAESKMGARDELVGKGLEVNPANNKNRAHRDNLKPKEKQGLDYIVKHGKVKKATQSAQPSQGTSRVQNSQKSMIEPNHDPGDFPWDAIHNYPYIHSSTVEEAKNIHEHIANSDVIKQGLPVYYPGSGYDVLRPLASTDADLFIFQDFIYVDEDGRYQEQYKPESDIEKLGGKIIAVEIQGVLGKGGKRVVTFEWGGKQRKVIQYAEDATTFAPEELKNGVAFNFISAPTQTTRSADGIPPGAIWSKENMSRMCAQVKVGGFINWSPTRILPPEIVGFTQIIHGNNTEQTKDLLKKTNEKDFIEPILELDESIAISLNILQGRYTGIIDDNTLNDYQESLQFVEAAFNKLPPHKKKELLPLLQELLQVKLTDELREQLKKEGNKAGFDNFDKQKQYIEQANHFAATIFGKPESQATPPPEVASHTLDNLSRDTSSAIKHVITDFGSQYNYLPDGRTQRYNMAKKKLYEPQDALVFVPSLVDLQKALPPQSYQDLIRFLGNTDELAEATLRDLIDRENAVTCIVDKDGKTLNSNAEISKSNSSLFLKVGEKDTGPFTFIPVARRPQTGYSTFDTRKFQDDKGNWMREVHLGNRVSEIFYKNSSTQNGSENAPLPPDEARKIFLSELAYFQAPFLLTLDQPATSLSDLEGDARVTWESYKKAADEAGLKLTNVTITFDQNSQTIRANVQKDTNFNIPVEKLDDKTRLLEAANAYIDIPKRFSRSNPQLPNDLAKFLVDEGFLREMNIWRSSWGFKYDSSSRSISMSELPIPPSVYFRYAVAVGKEKQSNQPLYPTLEEMNQYRFLHEANHAYQDYLIHKENPSDPEDWYTRANNDQIRSPFKDLFTFCMRMRVQNPACGLTTWGNQPGYDNISDSLSQRATRSIEDANELVTMYLWHPEYFEAYLEHLAQPDTQRYGNLIALDSTDRARLRQLVGAYVAEMKTSV